MKLALVLAFAFAGAFAHADKFKTVDFKSSTADYEVEVSYPEFFENAAPAFAQINSAIYKILITEGGCGWEHYEEDPPYSYWGSARVVGLNSRYIGVRVFSSDYCGGAHPNHYTFFLTFDSNNGKLLDIYHELGFLHYDEAGYDYDVEQARRRQLAELIVDLVPEEGLQCMENMTREEKLEEIAASYYPYPAGLAKGKTVVISTSVAHAMKPCEFSVRLTYQQVQSLIVPGSYLHTWLQ